MARESWKLATPQESAVLRWGVRRFAEAAAPWVDLHGSSVDRCVRVTTGGDCGPEGYRGTDALADAAEQARFPLRAMKFNLPWDPYRPGEAMWLHDETLGAQKKRSSVTRPSAVNLRASVTIGWISSAIAPPRRSNS